MSQLARIRRVSLGVKIFLVNPVDTVNSVKNLTYGRIIKGG